MNTLKVHFVNWFSPASADASGDCIVFENNGEFGIVDAGNAVSASLASQYGATIVTPEQVVDGATDLIARLDAIGVTDTNLKWFIQTHFHSDHAWFTDVVLRKYKPPYFYGIDWTKYPSYQLPDVEYNHQANNFWATNTFLQRTKDAVAEIGAVWITPIEEGVVRLGDAEFWMYNTGGINNAYGSGPTGDYNTTALTYLVKHGTVRMMFLSDSVPVTMNNIIQNKIGKVDLVQTGHHGYIKNLTFEMANTLKPSIVVQTKWKNFDTYSANHTGLYQLISPGVKIYRFHSSTNYNLYFESDGTTITETNDEPTTQMIWRDTWCDATRYDDLSVTKPRWYYFDSNGARQTGWKLIGGTWYYFTTVSSFIAPSGKPYYYGQMYYDESINIGGKVYNFDHSGACTNP